MRVCGHMQATVPVWKPDGSLWESVLSLHRVEVLRNKLRVGLAAGAVTA